MVTKRMVAMLLAGGQGTRLGVLTNRTAKPAVPFGGKYRIIDFPLSNCVNSDIDTVGVLTQYSPLELNAYLGNGSAWDLDRNSGGVYVLPPYVSGSRGEWYSGTANAIYQNLAFLRQYSPKYVLILSGDHIYKMNYAAMLRCHMEKQADATIAVLRVPIEEAHRFGIMKTNEEGLITDFWEKPKQPQSDKASMGIYIFSYDILEKYLTEDDSDENSSNDFGKNIIPKMLGDGKKMCAYLFEGYWKDVGTIKSLWEANMDLLGDNPAFDLYDRSWRIFYRHSAEPPQKLYAGSVVENSMVTEGCKIHGTVKDSVLSEGVIVEAGATVINSVVMRGAHICSGATVEYSIIDQNSVIGEGAHIGACNGSDGITVIAEELNIKPNAVIGRGEMIDDANAGDYIN